MEKQVFTLALSTPGHVCQETESQAGPQASASIFLKAAECTEEEKGKRSSSSSGLKMLFKENKICVLINLYLIFFLNIKFSLNIKFNWPPKYILT